MYRLLAMDLDKTLLNEKGTIPDDLVERLRDLSSKGVRIAICTGRVRRSAEHFARLLGGASIVSFNGSVIVPENGDIRTSEIPLALMKRVLDFCYREKLYIQLYRGETIVVDHFTEELETDRDTQYTDYEEVGDLRFAVQDPSPKMVALELSDRVDDIVTKMSSEFPELSLANSSKYVIEIVPRGIDKGYGLSIVADSLGIRREDVIAVGDSMNDLPMLKWAGLGVAVANADDRLKSEADTVTEGEMSSGVLEILDRYF